MTTQLPPSLDENLKTCFRALKIMSNIGLSLGYTRVFFDVYTEVLRKTIIGYQEVWFKSNFNDFKEWLDKILSSLVEEKILNDYSIIDVREGFFTIKFMLVNSFSIFNMSFGKI